MRRGGAQRGAWTTRRTVWTPLLATVSILVLVGLIDWPVGADPTIHAGVTRTTGLSHPVVAGQTSFAVVGKPSGSSSLIGVLRADTVLVFVAEHSSATVASLNDTLGNSFHRLGQSGLYTDPNGPERVTTYAAWNLTVGGSDRVNLATSSYAWTVVIVLDVRGVGSAPLDQQAPFSNSSQSGNGPSTVVSSVGAHSGDLVLLIGGIRGSAFENASGGDSLVASNASVAQYNGEQAAAFSTLVTANGTYRLTANNSNAYAPWLADSLSLRPGRAWCGLGCPTTKVTITAHTSFAFAASNASSSTFAAPAGGTILAFVNVRSTSSPSYVGDGAGDTFTKAAYGTIGGCCKNGLALYMSTAVAASGSESLSIGLPSSASTEVNVLVLSGVNTTQPFVARSAFSSNNYSRNVSSSLTAAGDLVLLDVAEWGQYSITAVNDSPVDERSVIVPWQNETGADFSLNSTSTSAVTLGASLSASDAWIALSVALSPGNGSAGGGPPATLDPPVAQANTSFAIVGAAHGTSSPIRVARGDALFVYVCERGSALVGSVGDTLGNTYRQLGPSGYYSDNLGPERVTEFFSGNLTHPGSDSVNVTTASYAWTVVLIIDVSGVAASPIDARSAFTNSSQAGQSPSTVRNTILANGSDLVLMVGGLRGAVSENASGGDSLVATNASVAPYTTERAAVFSWAQRSGRAGNVTMSASSSSGSAPWVAGAVALKPLPRSHQIQHVVVIMMENEARYQVLQGGAYERYLAATYGDASSFWAACHGSTPAYLAVTSGKPFQCGSASLTTYSTTEVGDLLENRSLTWADYQESMPTSCDSSSQGTYVYFHNPFVYYSDIVNRSSRCSAHVVNSRSFNSSFANGTLLNYSFYTPNLIDDCHNSSLSTCDGWLKGFLSPMLNTTNSTRRAVINHTVFFVVYDESLANDTGGYNGTTGGHAYLVAISPWSKSIRYSANATDYNLLGTIEWLFHLGNCGNLDGSASYPAMKGLFSFASNGY